MSKILVTGGLGYIGSHTAVLLLESGHDVLIADDLSNSRAEVLGGIEAITGKRPAWENVDLSDAAATASFLDRHQDVDNYASFH